MLHFIIIIHITTKKHRHSFQTVVLASQDFQTALGIQLPHCHEDL